MNAQLRIIVIYGCTRNFSRGKEDCSSAKNMNTDINHKQSVNGLDKHNPANAKNER